jgi:hypothetical protein
MLYAVLPDATAIMEAGRLEPAGMLKITQAIAGRLMIAALVVIGFVAGLDFLWQRWSFMQRMRMSRRDLREETKQAEGDPHIRAKLRAIRLERSRRRMLANVPKSTVVITNPTHYSVALRYLPETDAAPVCMATQSSDRGERGAGPSAVRQRGARREHSARAFRGGRQGHRLRHEHGEGKEAVMFLPFSHIHRVYPPGFPSGVSGLALRLRRCANPPNHLCSVRERNRAHG